MMAYDSHAFDQRLQLGMKRQPRLTELVLNDADAINFSIKK